MTESTNGILFDNLDALLDASMDDLEDLPPSGVPPTGHYNLSITFSIEEIGDEKKEIIMAKYVVDAINELKDPEDASEVALKQEFAEFFHLTKKDGSPNKFGIGKLKQRLSPFVERLNTKQIRELINGVKDFAIAASVKRTVNRKNEDQFNMDLKDVVVL
jgi:hypothetical protein